MSYIPHFFLSGTFSYQSVGGFQSNAQTSSYPRGFPYSTPKKIDPSAWHVFGIQQIVGMNE